MSSSREPVGKRVVQRGWAPLPGVWGCPLASTHTPLGGRVGRMTHVPTCPLQVTAPQDCDSPFANPSRACFLSLRTERFIKVEAPELAFGGLIIVPAACCPTPLARRCSDHRRRQVSWLADPSTSSGQAYSCATAPDSHRLPLLRPSLPGFGPPLPGCIQLCCESNTGERSGSSVVWCHCLVSS